MRLSVGWFALLCIFIGCVAPGAKAAAAPLPLRKAFDETPVPDDFPLAVSLYRRGRYQAAAEAFRNYLQQQPRSTRSELARLYLAMSLSSLEEYAEARRLFLEWLQVNPEDKNAISAMYRVGECSYFLKDYRIAEQQLSRYLSQEESESHSLRPWALLYRGASLNALERWEDAEPVLRQLLDAQPEPALAGEAGLALAKSFEGAGRDEQAVQTYRQAAASERPEDVTRALGRLAELYFRRGEYPRAAAVWDELAEAAPGSRAALLAAFNAGVAVQRNENHADAVSRFLKISDDSPAWLPSRVYAATSLRQLERTEEARSLLNDVLRRANAPERVQADALLELARLEAGLGNSDRAAALYKDFADRYPNDERGLTARIRSLERSLDAGNTSETRAGLSRLVKDFPKSAGDVSVRLLEARLLLRENQTASAITELQELLQAPSASAADTDVLTTARYHLIRALYIARDFEAAWTTYAELEPAVTSGRFPEFLSAIVVAADSAARTGRYQEALRVSDTLPSDLRDAPLLLQATVTRSSALAGLGRFPEALSLLSVLAERSPVDRRVWLAALNLGQSAWDRESYADSRLAYDLVLDESAPIEMRQVAARSAAWCLIRTEDYQEALQRLGAVPGDNQSPLKPADRIEQEYLRGQCYDKLGQPEKALAVFSDLLNQYADQVPAGAAEAGQYPEVQSPWDLVFESGLLAARTANAQQQHDVADQLWDRLITSFRNARRRDALLHEWAVKNLNAERYEQADGTYRRLLQDHPQSGFALTARLILAESDYLAERLADPVAEFRAIAEDAGATEDQRGPALFYLAEIHMANGQWEEALQVAEAYLTEYPTGLNADRLQLWKAESLIWLGRPNDGAPVLDQLRLAVLGGRVAAEDWTQRIWPAAAEAALRMRDYGRIDELTDELITVDAESPFLFQMRFLQGQRWKSQAPVDFQQARKYFRMVTEDQQAIGTETAAKAQFLIAETFTLENNLEAALTEYNRVYSNYSQAELRAEGLWQASGCEISLGRSADAVRTCEEIIREFPQSPFAEQAQQRLKELRTDASS